MADLQAVRQTLEGSRRELLAKSNVVACGVGYKTVNGKKTDELALICSVDSKVSKESLSASDIVPASIQNIPTDINPTGAFFAQQDPTGRFRPSPGGVSCGHFAITAGTYGCLVKKNDKLYILSNNHVLANSNDANIGDDILQPGPFDGGTRPADVIAKLSDFVEIQFVGQGGADPCGLAGAVRGVLNGAAAMIGSDTRLEQYRVSERVQQTDNLVDAAIAEPINQEDVTNDILQVGTISGLAEGTLGMAVKKHGRTTSFTQDEIVQIDVTVQVSYGTNKTAQFTNQLMTGAFSEGGDSGSAVVNDSNQLVGLLYAGSTTNTILNRIQDVFSLLNVTLP